MSDFRDVKGKVAIVTGAARGIGFSTAETLASEGIHVVMSDILPILDESCEKVSEAYPDVQVYAKAADVSDEAAVKALVDFTLEKFGKLDIMVHNAASFVGGMIEDYLEEDLDDSLGTNLKAAFSLAKAAIPHLKKQGGGRLLYTSSVTGPRVAMPGNVPPQADEPVPEAVAMRILVVDDEDEVRKVLGDMLESANYSVVRARDGQEAIDVYRREADSIDCVLLDLSMPKLDGEEVFHELRKIRSDVRVILNSGHAEQDILDRFQGAGLAGVVQKPAQMGVLLAKIAEATGRSPT